MPIIKLEYTIRAPIEVVFDLSRSIDLHKISTSQTQEEAIAGVTSGLIGHLETVTWRAKHLGFFHTLTSKITEFDAPGFFVDEMVEGPFARIRHEHHFAEVQGGTKMVDSFDYASPLGAIGLLADALFLKQYMHRFLIQRNNCIKEFAESGKWKEVLRP